MTRAQAPRKTKALMFFWRTPWGSTNGFVSSGSAAICASGVICSAIALPLAREIHALLTQLDVPVVHHLGDDVCTLAQIVVDEIGPAGLHLVHTELLRCISLDVGELVIVVHRLDIERRLVGLEGIVEFQL